MLINQDNFAYSVLISIDGGKSKGSGFRLKYKGYNFLVSAKHVFYNEDDKLYGDSLVVNCPSSPLGNGNIVFEIDLTKAKIFYSVSDVCIILLGRNELLDPNPIPLKKDRTKHKRVASLISPDYVTITQQTATNIVSVDIEATHNLKDIGIANEVYLMGYPTSLGLSRSQYFDITKPLLRKGIVSGINEAQKTFIIDCPSYQGNSGGPVVEKGRDGYFRVIGLVSQYIPYETKWFNNREKIYNTEVSNSGFSVCIPFDEIILLIEKNIASL